MRILHRNIRSTLTLSTDTKSASSFRRAEAYSNKNRRTHCLPVLYWAERYVNVARLKPAFPSAPGDSRVRIRTLHVNSPDNSCMWQKSSCALSIGDDRGYQVRQRDSPCWNECQRKCSNPFQRLARPIIFRPTHRGLRTRWVRDQRRPSTWHKPVPRDR